MAAAGSPVVVDWHLQSCRLLNVHPLSFGVSPFVVEWLKPNRCRLAQAQSLSTGTCDVFDDAFVFYDVFFAVFGLGNFVFIRTFCDLPVPGG